MTDPFLSQVRTLEERLFAKLLDPTDSTRLQSDQYSWLYRPSHHVATGLVTAADIELLKKHDRRLLSVGGHPGTLEWLLCELGVPPQNIVVADRDPALMENEMGFEKVVFDMTGEWPELGTFDVILFPESLCIALADHIKAAGPQGEGAFATDVLEAKLLSVVLRQALARLRPGGEIRANGPQSHPNVVKAARAKLEAEGAHHTLDYQRYFLRVRAA